MGRDKELLLCWRPLSVLFFVFLLAVLVCPQTETKSEKRLAKLRELQEQFTFIPMNETNYKRFVLPTMRPYDLLLLWTSDSVRCVPCGALNENLRQLLASHLDTLPNPQSRTLFAFVGDPAYLDVPAQKFGVRGLPTLLLLRSTEQQNLASSTHRQVEEFRPKSMQDLAAPFALSHWLEQKTSMRFPARGPLLDSPEVKQAVIAVPIAFVVFLLIYGLWQRQPLVFYLLTLCLYAFTLAGVIFNAIRLPPWRGLGQDLRPSYFAPGSRSQYIWEGVFMVILFYAGTASWVLLTDFVPRLENPWKRRGAFLGLFTVLAYVIHLILYIFAQHKVGGYPFFFH
ncbi:oligosaccharyl transferase subunit ost3/OST6 [Balamuthia mandrillaris]